MRRFSQALATVLALVVVAVIGLTAARNWMSPAQSDFTTPDGRPLVTAVQPGTVVVPAVGGQRGYDVSYPQCRSTLPGGTSGFAIIGLNRGKPFTANPCFARQWRWAATKEAAAVYINMADPGQPGAWSYGNAIGQDSVRRLERAGVPENTTVWLDVESINTWTDAARAVQVINATMATLTAAGHPVGIYAAPSHWFEITLNADVDVPVWLALGRYQKESQGRAAALAACQDLAFGQALPTVVQYVARPRSAWIDHNVRCPT